VATFVDLQRHDATALITLNRPESRNALSVALLDELTSALDEVAGDADVRAVVLTGADPAFCAGIDLKELGAGERNLGEGANAVAAIGRLEVPVVGAVNGPAVTGGLELALACDFRIGSERASFADTHARVGVLPGWGLTVQLPRVVGLPFAKQMSMTGNYVDAPTALRVGLLTQVVPHDELVDTALGLADDIASCHGPTQRRILAAYDEIAALVDEPGQRVEDRYHRAWNADLDPDAIDERRRAVTERGRSQRG
jgi:enoyl-CoA hydratase